MSDLFNQDKTKQTFEQLLHVTIDKESTTESALLPPKATEPVDGAPNAASLAKMAKELRIKTIIPMLVPGQRTFDSTDLFSEKFLETFNAPDTIQLNVADTEFFPSYYPVHKTYGYMDDIPGQVLYWYFTDSIDSNQSDLYEVMKGILENYCFSSGTFEGQLKRLRKIYDVNHGEQGMHKVKSIKEQGYTLETAANLMVRYLPVGLPPPAPELKCTIEGLALMGDETNSYMPTITAKAAAGVPFVNPNLSKGQAMISNVALCDALLRAVSAVLKGDITSAQLLEDWRWLEIALMVPKGERYSKTELRDKTRNIFSVPFTTNLLASVVSLPLAKSSPVNATNFDTPSLYKMNPLNGAFDRIVKKITKPGHHTLVYADNFYISYDRGTHHSFYSVDLAKGEANATPSHIQTVAYWLLTTLWTDEDGYPFFNSTWAYVALVLCPLWFCNATGLLMNQQFKIPGQASGQAWTFLTNHLMSAIVVEEWTKNQKDPSTPEFLEIAAVTGIDFKIEHSIENLEEEIQRVMLSTEHDYLQELPSSTPKCPELNLDMLGWAGVWSTKLNMWLPVLQRERLLKSLLLPKTPETKGTYSKQIWNRVLNFVRFEAGMYIGGWTDPLLFKSLKHLAESNRKAIQRAPPEEVARMLLEISHTGELSGILTETNPDLLFGGPFSWDKLTSLCVDIQPKTTGTLSDNSAFSKVISSTYTLQQKLTITTLKQILTKNPQRAAAERKRLERQLQDAKAEGIGIWAADMELEDFDETAYIDDFVGRAFKELVQLKQTLEETPTKPKNKLIKDPATAANPVVGLRYPLDYNTAGTMARLSKSQKKNKKKRDKRRNQN